MPIPIVDRVNLKEYCTAFGKIEQDPKSKNYTGGVCDALYPNWQSSKNDVFIYFNGKGSILVPEYAKTLGQKQIHLWHFLTTNDVKDLKSKNLSPEIASYFIAGAFGMNAIPYETVTDTGTPKSSVHFREDLDPRLAEGINRFYRHDLSEVSIAQNWKNVIGCRLNESPTGLDCEYDNLVSRIAWIETQIEESTFRDIYEGLVRPYKDILALPATTQKEMEKKIRSARNIVAIAMRHQKGEEDREKRFALLELGIVYEHLKIDIETSEEMKTALERAEGPIVKQGRKDRSLDGQLKTMKLKINAAEEILNRNRKKLEEANEALRQKQEQDKIDTEKMDEE